MNKKVLIISSSPRKGGNSETLAAAFAKGAREAGHQVETVYLREKNGCNLCCNPFSLFHRDELPRRKANQRKIANAQRLHFLISVLPMGVLCRSGGQMKNINGKW